MNRVSFSFHFFLPSTQYKYLPSVFLKCEEKKRNECNTQKTVESKTGERTMTEDNNPSHENKGERSKGDTENIKARERENKREKDDDRSEFPRRRRDVLFFISLIFSRRSMTRKTIFCSNPIDREWKRCPHLLRLLLPKSLKLRWCV